MANSTNTLLTLTTYRNASAALLGELHNIMTHGEHIAVRGNGTWEVRMRSFQITSPLERCIVIPHRNNNIFSTIAESAWVISGRNDLDYLKDYLPRATGFSDDGQTWRAGYGPRLRNWNGIDQVRQIYRLLSSDPNTRRAVMILFDPDRDFTESKDIPCNNWLHWTLRNGKLDLSVAIRSNDLLWGFSGINTFEWSLLQEMMANWLGVEVGTQTYFIGSLHLYERHLMRARKLLANTAAEGCYTKKPNRNNYRGEFDTLGSNLDVWFDIEKDLRSMPDTKGRIDSFPEPLFKDYLYMLQAYWVNKRGASLSETKRYLSFLSGTDLEIAALEYFERIHSIR